ncbi:sodium:proton antiporter NhaD [Pleionea sediminis]|uniref:sodium:proton antiporter NhaD n=1 Tax=Pleionea sediminis TaxID=2569479 RepID=UPI001185A3CC|nr:sodium:proton antiporter NhaD [Pleionea sediminis]
MSYVILTLIVLGFLSIVVEDIVHINKAKTTLFFGSLVWLLYYVALPHGHDVNTASEALNENLLDIATLWLFLMAAMTFVAYLSSKGIIDGVIQRLLPEKMSEKTLMFLTGFFAFLFSSLADNITSTLVCVSILLSLKLETAKLIRFLVLVIFSVNAGGAALITGDVTTLMIFLAGKVQIMHLFLIVLPALIAVLSLATLLSWSMTGEVIVSKTESNVSSGDKIIGVLFFCTIVATLVLNILFSIPPVLVFLFGLSTMFLVVQFLNRDEPVLDYVRRIEFDTLLFFLGVLLLVGMMKEQGVLNYFPELYQHIPALGANYVIGLLSAMFDNVPLTAALLKSGVAMSLSEWLVLTYSVGVGGALLVIGSAAGVVAMSKVEGLTFITYLKFFGYLLIAYSIGFLLVVVFSSFLN